MAGNAAEFGENFLSGRRERTGGTAIHPRLILRWFLDYDRAHHAGVLRAAIFRAEQMIDAGFGGAEPFHGVTAGQHVLLDAESGNIKTVDHVLRGHN